MSRMWGAGCSSCCARRRSRPSNLPANAIIVADDLLPSQTATLDRSRVVGFCTAGGGPSAHSAILARSMGIPAVVAIGPELTAAVRDGITLALDGNRGTVIVEPDADTTFVYAQAQSTSAEARSTAWAAAQRLTRTHDGVRVEVVANLGAAADAAMALEAGAEGVGLLRTEFLFQERLTPPSEEEQFAIYQSVAQVMGDRPVIIRTLDIGGDKPAPYLAAAAGGEPVPRLAGDSRLARHAGVFQDAVARAHACRRRPAMCRSCSP